MVTGEKLAPVTTTSGTFTHHLSAREYPISLLHEFGEFWKFRFFDSQNLDLLDLAVPFLKITDLVTRGFDSMGNFPPGRRAETFRDRLS